MSLIQRTTNAHWPAPHQRSMATPSTTAMALTTNTCAVATMAALGIVTARRERYLYIAEWRA